MAKGNLINTARELVEQSAEILAKATRARRDADAMFDELKRMDAAIARRKEEAAAQRKREEQMRVQSTHSRAFTMLDEEEKAQMEAALREEREKAAQTEQQAPAGATAPEKAEPKAEAAARCQDGSAREAGDGSRGNGGKACCRGEGGAACGEAGAEAGQGLRSPGTEAETARHRADYQPSRRRAASAGQTGRPRAERDSSPAARKCAAAGPLRPSGRNPGAAGRIRPPRRRSTAGPLWAPGGRTAASSGPLRASGRNPGSAGRLRPSGQRSAGRLRPSGRKPRAGTARPAGRVRSAERTAVRPQAQLRVEKERVSNYDPNKKNYERQHDPERQSRNKKQQSKQNSRFNGYDDEPIRGGKRARAKKPSAQQMMAPIKIETAYMAGDTITVRDLTEKIGKPAGEIIKKLFMLGNMATINSEIDFDTAQLVCSDFEITLERKQEQTAEAALVAEDFTDEEENLVARPPVVTIMGHVDHGKTSLLDYIRKSRVTQGEAGGITQHIGAYMVDVDGERKITFLDTPGHEAFTAMRARGAQATDIAVLVVAADDSVMPQTVESINHAKAAEVPIIVAINKMDKPEANPDRVKQDLTQYGLVCEDWGGETICVPVSAKTGEGVDELLEMILLQADMLQLRANPNRLGRGVIIEAKLDKARGPLATVLLQNGTLHVGDSIIAGMASGKVRALINDRGERVQDAGPGTPVEIMGFDDVPSAGDELIAVGDDHLSRQVADERREKLRASREASMAKVNMENLFSTIEAGKITTLNLIIKADVQGSVEAVKQAMEKLSTDEVKIRVLHSAAGAITKDDVNLASAFNAIIIGFNIRPDASAREAAEKQKVDVRLYTVIYKAIEDMELAMKGMLEPEYREVLLGHAEVRNVFKITGAGIIAGCYVTDGKVQRNANVRLLRDNVVVHEGKLSSLRHLKDDVKEMAAGYECGMSLEGHNDIKEGDVVECFIMEEIPR